MEAKGGKDLKEDEKIVFADAPPLICKTCQGIYTQMNYADESNKKWHCIFCNKPNKLPPGFDFPVKGDSSPAKEEKKEVVVTTNKSIVCYPHKLQLESRKLEEKKEAAGPLEESKSKKDGDTRILFLVDKSGSMSAGASQDSSPAGQVVDFIKKEMQTIKEITPHYKVGVIFFSHLLKIFGDGSNPPLEIKDKSTLENADILRKIIADNSNKLINLPIKDSYEGLIKLLDKDADGQTAMGPALVVAMELVKACKSSKIYVFTDGQTNLGVGNMDKDMGVVDKNFYLNLAKEAREIGTEVSIFKIKGQAHFLGDYNRLVKQTGGILDEVDPNKISQSVNLGKVEVELASNVLISLRLPEIFKVRLISEFDPKKIFDENVFTKKYGRIIHKAEELIQFQLNPPKIGKTIAKVSQLKKVPFQLTISFIGIDGKDYTIVYTKEFQCIHKKEKQFDPEVCKQVVKEDINNMIDYSNVQQAQVNLDLLLGEMEGEDEYIKQVREVAAKASDERKKSLKEGECEENLVKLLKDLDDINKSKKK